MMGCITLMGFYLLVQAGAEPAKPVSPNDVLVDSSDTLSYTYNPFGKRDPFRSYLSEKGAKNKDSKDPLLNFDLSKFNLTGLLWGIANPKAIVVDGEGHGHVISRGTRIGRNKGQVVRIIKDEVVISEEYRDALGKLMISDHSLKLTKEEGK